MKMLAVFAALLVSLAAKAQSLSSEFYSKDDEDFRAELSMLTLPASKWISKLNRDGFDFLCLGETHDSDFRAHYAKVLKGVSANVFAIEETAEKAQILFQAYREGKAVSLLTAPMNDVLNSVTSVNPAVTIVGVEPSESEKLESTRERMNGRARVNRDGFIASHISQLMTRSSRVVALYGSLHCADRNLGLGASDPFITALRRKYPGKNILCVLQIAAGDYRTVLRVFADSFKLATQQDMVIVGGKHLDPAIYNYRADIGNLLQSYDVIYLPKALPAVD